MVSLCVGQNCSVSSRRLCRVYFLGVGLRNYQTHTPKSWMLTSALSRIRTRRSCTSSYGIRLTVGTHGRSIGHGPPTITVANRIQPGPTSMATSCLVVIPPFKAPSSTTSFLHGFGVAYSSISSRLSSSLPLNHRYSLFLGMRVSRLRLGLKLVLLK